MSARLPRTASPISGAMCSQPSPQPARWARGKSGSAYAYEVGASATLSYSVSRGPTRVNGPPYVVHRCRHSRCRQVCSPVLPMVIESPTGMILSIRS